MKRYFLLTAIFLQTLLFATDYSQMSIEEMNQMRGKVQTEEKAQFQKAYQEKLQQLPAEERYKYTGKPDGVTAGSGQGINQQGLGGRQMLQDGSGAGLGRSGGSMGGGRRGR